MTGCGLSENIAAMTASAERVVAAEVTRAVRDSMTDAGPCERRLIGLSRDGIVASRLVVGASCACSTACHDETSSYLIEGEVRPW